MQDRYAGDIGDYGKIALLKCLQKHGFKIGINWYRVPELDIEKNHNGTFKQDDGKHHISKKLATCDPDLASILEDIAFGKNRSIASLQKADLILGAEYFNESVPVSHRDKWHERALKKLNDTNLVFVDPDNGLLVKSVKKSSVRSVKYVYYEEIKECLNRGKSVLIYNHRCRKAEQDYFNDILSKLPEYGISKSGVQAITFPKGSVRDYIAISACKEHFNMIKASFEDMVGDKWGVLGVCRIPKLEISLKYNKLVAVHDDSMFMYAELGIEDLTDTDKCIVYNKETREYSPELCVGSWTCRMGPWSKPTSEQIEESIGYNPEYKKYIQSQAKAARPINNDDLICKNLCL